MICRVPVRLDRVNDAFVILFLIPSRGSNVRAAAGILVYIFNRAFSPFLVRLFPEEGKQSPFVHTMALPALELNVSVLDGTILSHCGAGTKLRCPN